MSVTYQIEPVIDVVRAFIDQQLSSSGMPAQVLPTMTTIAQYPFDSGLCPLLVLEPVVTTADWRQYAAGNVTLSLELNLHEICQRSGTAVGGEETVAVQVLCELASAFAVNYRLGGNVQNVLVESIALAEPSLLHRVGVPDDQFTLFAAATMKLRIVWVESSFAAA